MTNDRLQATRLELLNLLREYPQIGKTWKAWNDESGQIPNEELFYFGFLPNPQIFQMAPRDLKQSLKSRYAHGGQYIRLPAAMWAEAPAPQHQQIVPNCQAVDLPEMLRSVQSLAKTWKMFQKRSGAA